MYNNPYVRNYNQQNMYDQIDNQINQLQQMREQMKNNANQQPAINQTFQLAPSNLGGLRYFNTIDDVEKEVVYNETPFFSKDMSVLWLKNNKGEIRTYELKEIVPKDERDLLIESLQMQVSELRREIKDNAKSINIDDDEPIKNETASNVPIGRKSTKKSKQSDGNV